MEPNVLAQDFRDILVELADAGAEFVLIGGWAMAYHGHIRGTDDLDIFVRPSLANASRVFVALSRFGAPVSAHGVTEELFSKEKYGYRFGVKPYLIEILTTIDGIGFDEAINDAKTVEIDGCSIPVLSRAALLQNKRAAGRPKDLADVHWLETHPDSSGD